MKPIVHDLFCGLGGWAEGFLSEGYECIGYDIEKHDYGTGTYPGTLILCDVRSIHGSQLADATCIVASPPCQAYSYRAMPWKRAKALPPPDNTLFNECFRIQREASEAAGRYIPMVVENVRGAEKWVGSARWHFGSYYLWGDVPALMPLTFKAQKFNPDGTAHPAGSWFAIADSKNRGSKVPGFRFDGSGRSFQTASVKTTGHVNKRDGHTHARHLTNQAESGAVKYGGDWFNGYRKGQGPRNHASKSKARARASAEIAKIPFPLSQHIARCFKPILVREVSA